MSEKKVYATARVQVTLEIIVPSKWGGDSPMSQVHRQAAESALGILVSALRETASTQQLVALSTSATIVGEPKVVAVLAEEK